MILLAIDTTNAVCSVALIKDNDVIAFSSNAERNQHARILFSLIDNLFQSSGYSYKEINAFAVAIGPGSFTGIRIGIAAIKGLQIVTAKPARPISMLEATAYTADNPEGKNIQVILDAKRGKFYTQRFNAQLEPLNLPDLCENINSNDDIICGINPRNMENISIADATHIGMVALRKQYLEPQELKPLYIRPHYYD